MKKRNGMNIYRLERDGEEPIVGDAADLYDLGLDVDQVRNNCAAGKKYLGYTITVVGKRILEPDKKPKSKNLNLDQFAKIADSESKSYGDLQLEEFLGRKL